MEKRDFLRKRFFGYMPLVIFFATWFLSCNREFDPPKSECDESIMANATYTEIKELYIDETVQIQENLIIEGFVISSDQDGNFFSVLHIQDAVANPKEAFQIEIDIRDSHLLYPIGSKVYVKLKGLYLGKSGNAYKLGATFESFGNVYVGRLPANVVDEHIVRSCDDPLLIQPVKISIEKWNEYPSGILVSLDSLEFVEEELRLPFANEAEETVRTLINCDDQIISLVNSGYSDFQSEIVPELNGRVTGILLEGELIIRSLQDMEFINDRCAPFIDEFTSNQLFISELADPDNNAGARFVEIFNASEMALSLKGWSLVRFTNANTDVSSTLDLSGIVLEGNKTFVISPNAEEFERVYGFTPDMAIGSNSPADSNGDDNLQLIDPFGKVIDAFGIVGEDGSGTDHEFEDGRALRKLDIDMANPNFTNSEWEIYNDTGAAGTNNQPQIAPEDFTPGDRN